MVEWDVDWRSYKERTGFLYVVHLLHISVVEGTVALLDGQLALRCAHDEVRKGPKTTTLP